jgi:hypothetical protein
VKRTRILTTVLSIAVLVSMSGCGSLAGGDYIKSITLSSNGASAGGFYNLSGVDGTLQLVVTANYNSGKELVVTNAVTWSVSPQGTLNSSNDPNYPAGGDLPPYGPTTVPISATGLMTGIDPICTWVDVIETTNGTTAPANPPVWEYTGYYQVTATYRSFTSQPVGIGVGITSSTDSPVGGCGPS